MSMALDDSFDLSQTAGARNVVAAGGIKALLQLIEQGKHRPNAGTGHATRALAGLTADCRAAMEAAREDGASLLVELLGDGGQQEIALHAATALGNIAAWDESRCAVDAAGALAVLVDILQSPKSSEALVTEAARALANLSLAPAMVSGGLDGGAMSPRHSTMSFPAGKDSLEPGLHSSPTSVFQVPSSVDSTPVKGASSPSRTKRSSPKHTSRTSNFGTRHSRSSVKKLIAETLERVSRRPVHSGPWVPPLTPNYLARAPSPPRPRTNRLLPYGTKRSSTLLVSGSRHAADALEELRDPAKDVLMRADASIAELIAVLVAGGPADRWASSVPAAAQIAARQLSNEERQLVCNLGGISKLVEMLEGGVDSEVVRVACAAISQLCYSHAGNTDAIREAGGIERLALIIKKARPDGEVALWATCSLTQVTYKNTANCRALLETGAAAALVDVLRVYSHAETRGNALRVLCNLAHLPEACSAIREANGIALLVVELRGNPTSESTTVAARTLLNVACHDMHQSSIRDAGGVAAFVKLLGEDPEGDVTMVAALTLTQLALGSEENCMDIRAHGGIEKLMRLLRSCNRSSDMLRVALGALLNLSNHTKISEEALQHGMIPELVRLLQSSEVNNTVQLQTARIVSNLALNKANSDTIRIAGGVRPLVALAGNPPSTDIARVAAVALSQLAFDNPSNQNAIRDAGGVAPLVRLLDPAYQETAKWAGCALAEISFNNHSSCEEIRVAGGVKGLVALLKTTVELTATVQVVRALANLALEHPSQNVIREQGAIPFILPLLKQGTDENAKVVGACAIAELAFSNTLNGDEIINEGGLRLLLDLLTSRPKGPALVQTLRAVAELVECSVGSRGEVAKDRYVMDFLEELWRPGGAGCSPAATNQATRILKHVRHAAPAQPMPASWEPYSFSTPTPVGGCGSPCQCSSGIASKPMRPVSQLMPYQPSSNYRSSTTQLYASSARY